MTYKNVQIIPRPGDKWSFHDNDGCVTEWKIAGVVPEEAAYEANSQPVIITKLTGEGAETYQAVYPFKLMLKAPDWFPISDVAREVIFCCPACEEFNPIALDDYICVECRKNDP